MASSFQGKLLSAEQARAQFRQSLRSVADPLRAPEIVDAIDEDADNLMPADKVGSPIEVDICLWPNREPGMSSMLFLEYQQSGMPGFSPIDVSPEEVSDDKPESEFPLRRSIPLRIFENIEGTFKFRYRVILWNNTPMISLEAPVTIDRLGPLQPDAAPQAMRIDEPLITDATLARDAGVKCVVPAFVEAKKEFVRIAVGWMDKLPEDESEFPELVAVYDLLPQPSQEITVPALWITDLGSTTQYVVYFLFDKAGNRSQMSLPKAVSVALGVLPDDLEICEVKLEKLDGLYDRADAAIPATVTIEEYTGWERDDGIVIQWGDTEVARTNVGVHLPFPLCISLPWATKRDEYDFSGPQVQVIDVDYTVFRGDHPFPSPGAIQVNTDYKIAGPVNPDPGPINPDLLPIVFESSEGSATELVPDDHGNDATAHITLFDTPVPTAGDILTVVYNGIELPGYPLKASDGPGAVIKITIPWLQVIEKTLVMVDLPMYYTLTRAGLKNPQESERTKINVMLETVDLPEPVFLDPADPTRPLTLLNCEALQEINGVWGVLVHIPTSRYLVEGAEITLFWMSFESDGTTELPRTDHLAQFKVTADHEAKGVDWLIPNARCLVPTYRPPVSSAGRGKVAYSLSIQGTPVASDVVTILIGMFEEVPPGSGADHCKLTKPPRQ